MLNSVRSQAVHSGLLALTALLLVGAVLAGLLLTSPRSAQAGTPVTDCSVTGLQAALNAGGVVTFNCGGPVTIGITTTLTVPLPVTVDGGNQVTLDGQSARRILSMTAGAALTLSNITLQNGYADDDFGGAAVFAPAGSALSIQGSRILTNTTANGLYGGAVTALGSGPVGILSSTFTANTSAASGGAIHAEGRVLVQDTSFLGNSSATDGGALRAGDVLAARSAFTGNQAGSVWTTGSGGAVYASGQLTATEASALANVSNGFGGAMYAAQGARVISGTFRGNQASGGSGGGVYAATGHLDVRAGLFVTNTAPGGGGAVGSDGSLAVRDTVALSNSGSMGAGVYAATDLTLVGVNLSGNENVGMEGGGGYGYASVTAISSTVAANRGASIGGGLYTTGRMWLTATAIVSNSAGLEGGGAYAAAEMSVAGSQSALNVAGTNGGGFWAQSIAITGSTVLSNAARHGGGIYVNGDAVFEGTVISGNVASANGGGVYASYVTLANMWLGLNVAQEGGGLWTPAYAIVRQTSVVSNTATGQGGGFWAAVGDINVTESLLQGNRSLNADGGAVFALNAVLSNTTAIGNRAASGGGLLLFSGSANLQNVTAIDNGTRAISSTTSLLGIVLRDSVLGGPGAPICHNVLAAFQGANLVQDTSCGGSSTATLNLGPLQDNGGLTLTVAPNAGSPAIGAAGGCLARDQRGLQRVAPCDIGAYETGAGPTLIALSPASTPFGGPGLNLTVNGNGFGPGTVALWNGAPRQTAVLSQNVLTIAVTASDIVTEGVAIVRARLGTVTDSLSNALTFTVTKASQTISFAPLSNRIRTDPPFTVTATASSGLPVTFSASGVCTVAGITVTLAGSTGVCTITAAQSGNANYAEAPPVARTFNVSYPTPPVPTATNVPPTAAPAGTATPTPSGPQSIGPTPTGTPQSPIRPGRSVVAVPAVVKERDVPDMPCCDEPAPPEEEPAPEEARLAPPAAQRR